MDITEFVKRLNAIDPMKNSCARDAMDDLDKTIEQVVSEMVSGISKQEQSKTSDMILECMELYNKMGLEITSQCFRGEQIIALSLRTFVRLLCAINTRNLKQSDQARKN